MTQVTKYEPRQMQPLDFTGMLEVAKQLVGTGFLPEHIKTPGQCVAIIMAGRELGMEPMQALRSIVMVKGKVVVSADAQLGLFKAAGGRAQFSTLNDQAAILDLVHPNGDRHTETFTIEDAKRAGLTKNATWTMYPKAMLRSRCITAGLKSVGYEPTAGAYDPEEAAAFTDISTNVRMPEPGLVADALPEKTEDEGEINRETPYPNGRMKGKTVAELPTTFLRWAVEPGRNLDGDNSEAWQQLCQAELDRREPLEAAEPLAVQ